MSSIKSSKNPIQSHAHWLRRRALGLHQPSFPLASIDSIQRLKLENCLGGHLGCVNCLEWNLAGDLLASGSDDRNVIIWDPFKGVKRHTIRTGHEGNIFSVKFIPNSSDALIATCANDGKVKLIDTIGGENLMNCKSCHHERVKRLETHTNEPHLIWSAGEDGYIMQYDIRENHHCNSSKPKNLLIDLKSTGDQILSAKCLAINPIRDEMLAIGSNDVYIRLFDRRYMRKDGWNSCTTYFTPGHLLQKSFSMQLKRPPSFGVTYLSFSPDGSELLANMHAEQVYLFKVYEPQERCKSFESTIRPLILDLETAPDCGLGRNRLFPIKTQTPWNRLKKLRGSSKLPEKYCDYYQKVRKKLQQGIMITKSEFDELNSIISNIDDCLELYSLRASALILRGWRGDYYQAIIDCCCALALNPLDLTSFDNLAAISKLMGDKEAGAGLIEIVHLLKPDIDQLQQTKALNSLLKENSSPKSWFDLQQASSNLSDSTNPDGLDSIISMDTSIAENQRLSSTILFNEYYETALDLAIQARQERQRAFRAFDYTKRFCGHCNMNTDIKEANFFGNDGKFIIAGSDDGAFYIWDKQTTNLIKAVQGDLQILNCLQPHPSVYMLATSGIEPLVKLWSPSGKISQDVEMLEQRCAQNHNYITSDPLEAMIMMLYPNLSRDT